MTELTLPNIDATVFLISALLFAIAGLVTIFSYISFKYGSKRTNLIAALVGLVFFVGAITSLIVAENIGNEAISTLKEWSDTNYGVELDDSTATALYLSHEAIVESDGEPTKISLDKFEDSWLLFVDGKPMESISE